jgi:sarcosine oxidase subunit beta
MSGRRAVIIGAGITGVLTGLALRDAGWEVTLLEAEHVGSGSSSRTAAGIRQQFSQPSTVRAMRYALQTYLGLKSRLGLDQPIVVQNGYLFLAGDDDALAATRARVATQQAAGLSEVEALDHDALRRRFPWVDDSVAGASWCPTDGFLHPPLIYQEGARLLRELGGVIVQKAPVTAATHVGGRLAEVLTPRGGFGADLFIDATNAWAQRTALALGAERLPVDPLKRYLWFVARSDEGMARETLASMPLVVGPTGVYVRPENHDLLMMGHAHHAAPEPDFTREDQDRIDPEFDPDHGVDSRAYAAWLQIAESIPGVGAFDGITATTSGFYGVTPDHNPYLGFDRQVPNLLRLVGFSGHGAMFGPFTAAVAAALAEAGRDLDTLDLPTGAVSLADFRIGRVFGAHEKLVI